MTKTFDFTSKIRFLLTVSLVWLRADMPLITSSCCVPFRKTEVSFGITRLANSLTRLRELEPSMFQLGLPNVRYAKTETYIKIQINLFRTNNW